MCRLAYGGFVQADGPLPMFIGEVLPVCFSLVALAIVFVLSSGFGEVALAIVFVLSSGFGEVLSGFRFLWWHLASCVILVPAS